MASRSVKSQHCSNCNHATDATYRTHDSCLPVELLSNMLVSILFSPNDVRFDCRTRKDLQFRICPAASSDTMTENHKTGRRGRGIVPDPLQEGQQSRTRAGH